MNTLSKIYISQRIGQILCVQDIGVLALASACSQNPDGSNPLERRTRSSAQGGVKFGPYENILSGSSSHLRVM